VAILRLGLEAYSFHAPFADHIDIGSPESNHRDQAVAEILCAAEAAAILEVRYFVIHPGPEHTDPPQWIERFERLRYAADALNLVAERCNKLGITCVLENKLPHLLHASASDILWILAAMNSVNVGVCLDTGHAYLSGDIYNVMHKLSRHLRMVHAHDNSGHGDEHLAPGTGQIDWDRVLSQLAFSDFRGGIILELADRGNSETLLSDARRARLLLRDISRRLSLAQ
jgi:sugar phosphate isomerase/epimerase